MTLMMSLIKEDFVYIKMKEILELQELVHHYRKSHRMKQKDMKDIIIIESMDLMRDDIYSTFKGWIGKYKNKYDNQVLFFYYDNAYFKELAREDILDKEYNNYSEVDVEAQRLAWLAVGKTEVEDMEDEEIKKLTFKKKVFMMAQIKILNAVEDFIFTIDMF